MEALVQEILKHREVMVFMDSPRCTDPPHVTELLNRVYEAWGKPTLLRRHNEEMLAQDGRRLHLMPAHVVYSGYDDVMALYAKQYITKKENVVSRVEDAR